MTLWTAADAVAATGGEAQGSEPPDWKATGVSIDTRELAPGDLFIALEGISHDGHVYVAKALEAGAVAAMVSHVPDGVPEDAPLLVVDDTLAGLQALGAAGRARTKAKVIGVTGSVGKTSTKDMLAVILGAQGKTHAAIRSFNNHWGVPLTLARMPADTEYAVIEIGMNSAGEIKPLSELAQPHVGLITTIEAVHLENLGSVEAIADEKAQIFAGISADGIAVLPYETPQYPRLLAAAKTLKTRAFGKWAPGFRLILAEPSDGETIVTADIHGHMEIFRLATSGTHFATNALGALAAAEAAGADVAQAMQDLAAWVPPSGRGARADIAIPGGQIAFLDESYNANPASLGAALTVLAADQAATRRIAILGDMLELGPTENALHTAIADHPAIAAIDQFHTCGPRMRHLHDALPEAKRGLWAKDSEALAKDIGKRLDPGDTVMVKGSLGAQMAVIVDTIKRLGESSVPDVDGSV